MRQKSAGFSVERAKVSNIPTGWDQAGPVSSPSKSSKLSIGEDSFAHQSMTSTPPPHKTPLHTHKTTRPVDEQSLRHALNRLRQTRSMQHLSQALESKTIAQQFVTEPATLHALQQESVSLIRTLQRKGLPASVLVPLQRDLQKLTGIGDSDKAPDLANFSETLQRVLQGLLTASQHPSLKIEGVSAKDASVSSGESTSSVEGVETKKEKSIWEKISDFFKKVFQVLLKVFDFLSPLLNLIPGVGPAIFAAYQGIKLIVSLVKGDVAGVIGSLASMAGGMGGSVAGVAGSVLKITSKAMQAGHALAQAIESKNPLAILGALGSVSGSLGQIGKSLGSISKGATQVGKGIADAARLTQQGLQVATAGVSFVDGAAKGNPDLALSGLAGMMGAAGSMTGGDTQKILQHASQGVSAVQNIAQGRYDVALQGFANTLTPLAQLPEAKEAVAHVQTGIRMMGDLVSGNFAQASQQAMQQVTAATRTDPKAQQAMKHLTPVVGFLSSLAQPQTAHQLGQMTRNWNRVNQQPDFLKAMKWCTQLGQSMSQIPTNQPERLLSQVQILTAVKQLQDAQASGRLEQGIHTFCTQLQKHLNHPTMASVSQWMTQGHHALQSLLSGKAVGALQHLQQHPQLQQNLDLAMMKSTLQDSQQFLQRLLGPRLGTLLGQLQEKSPSLVKQVGYLNFLQQTSDLREALGALHTGEAHQRLQHTTATLQKQVTPEALKELLLTPVVEQGSEQ